MPVYICYRGDCDNLALDQSGGSLIVAPDALGLNWLCIESTLLEIPNGLPDSVRDMIAAQRRAYEQGFSNEGTQQIQLDCPDDATLRRALVLITYPDASESEERLKRAGWAFQRWSEPLGKPGKHGELILTNGKDSLTVEGETKNEAWYQAVQKILKPGPLEQALRGQPMSDRIVINPKVMLGKPIIRGTRIPVELILRKLSEGASEADLLDAYPRLAAEDIRAALAYAAASLANEEVILTESPLGAV